MKNIQYVLSILLLIFLGVSCQENYELIPPPNPDDYKDPPRFATMYMVGDATPNGWDIESATAMKQSADNKNIFTWEGALTAGEIKFPINRSDGWGGAFFMAGQAGAKLELNKPQTLRYSQSGDGGSDDKFRVEEAGNYKLTINALEETLLAEKI
ncbi:SusF/SusE family outer membrane protein [Proteiniphilum acetatigenes]|uniref:SusF/SusE family outer membrane protein n=1 Tax=Proteiniphilum acetatigenes TaxID=294710 RepID=UPI000365EF51|nr:SusF/SusE family outer membrane protein [Proteiniphilum acetatigenes]SFK96524.1 protein of unknown function [Porphyromonadaceae bacterium KH3CP3RA]